MLWVRKGSDLVGEEEEHRVLDSEAPLRVVSRGGVFSVSCAPDPLLSMRLNIYREVPHDSGCDYAWAGSRPGPHPSL
jgi:hypothetical protein